MIELITEAANMVGVSAQLLLAICTIESGLVNQINVRDGNSPSYGICQIKYETALMFDKTIKRNELLRTDLNVKMAAMYLKWQLSRYPRWCAVKAYNQGSSKNCSIESNYVYKVRHKYASLMELN